MGAPLKNRKCTVPGCTAKHNALGLCLRHYWQKRYGSELTLSDTNPLCKIPGCNRLRVGKKLCGMHYQRLWKYGDPMKKFKNGAKSKGGHQYYPNHSLLKRNRLIKLKLTPVCEFCGIREAILTHHRDGKRANHSIDNLMSMCGRKCHMAEHRKMKEYKVFKQHTDPKYHIPYDQFLSSKEIQVLFENDQKSKA